MDCTICANEVSRREGFSATRGPVSRGGSGGGRRRSGGLARRFRSGPVSCGLPRSQMCFCFTKTLARGAIPRTPNTTSAPERADRPNIVRPREPDGAANAKRLPRPGLARRCPERPAASRSVSRCSAVTERRSTPSRRDRWRGSDPAGRAAWACTCRTAPMPHRAYRRAGALPSTARRGGSAPAIRGPWPNPKPSGGLRSSRFAPPEHNSPAQTPRGRIHTSGSATGFAPPALHSDSLKAAGTQCRMSADLAFGKHGTEQPSHLAETIASLHAVG